MVDVPPLAERLVSLREGAELSQRALSSRSGVSLSLIQKIEQGLTADPKLSTLRALTEALGVPVSDLIGDQPPRRRKKEG